MLISKWHWWETWKRCWRNKCHKSFAGSGIAALIQTQILPSVSWLCEVTFLAFEVTLSFDTFVCPRCSPWYAEADTDGLVQISPVAELSWAQPANPAAGWRQAQFEQGCPWASQARHMLVHGPGWKPDSWECWEAARSVAGWRKWHLASEMNHKSSLARCHKIHRNCPLFFSSFFWALSQVLSQNFREN